MLRFCRITDYDLIRRIMTHPRIWDKISDDYSGRAGDFQPIDNPGIWYVSVHDDDELLGMWMFVQHSVPCWEVHTCLLPNAWGPRAIDAAKAMADWIWQHTDCQRIITNIPVTNKLALRFALGAGMTRIGVNERSFMKHGRLIDQIILGVSPCQQQ